MVVSVDFVNPSRIFVAGEHILGHVEVQNFIRVKTVVVILQGHTRIEWKDGCSKHTGERKHIDERLQLEEAFSNSVLSMAPPFQYYPFTYVLPADLPSSITGKFGQTDYYMEVELISSRGNKKRLIKEPFYVVAPSILGKTICGGNCLHININEVVNSVHETPTVFNSRIQLSTNKYCAGDVIPLFVYVSNSGPAQVDNMTIALKRILTFNADKPVLKSRETCDVVEIVHFGNVRALQETTVHFSIHIPITCPPTSLKSTLIEISYCLVVAYKIKGHDYCVKKHIEISTKFDEFDQSEILCEPSVC